MGGAARSFIDGALDQLEYRLSIGAMKPEEYKFYKSQFELLNNPNFSSQNPPKDFQLGSPVYWDSIRKIKAAEMSKEQKHHFLFFKEKETFKFNQKVKFLLERTIKREITLNIDYIQS